ncbi:MAG: phosphoribosylaminoimidazolesuccinocarboxamide synthase [Spirochaetales bacterium]|jgi:phosphoribosylaminoimidazole-succinocarboxamide synthase|nr:phosphoribosylaminoimidazolesuccinocarboxamide synthase [Spirochaetales bacterium]
MKKNEILYKERIAAALHNCLTETDIDLPGKRRGKVRDSYKLKDKMVFVTTDRQSAFDRILASVPFKGQVLNLTSTWWFEHTSHIVQNHLVAVPDPNITIAKACTVFPIEFVVRGYITGTTSTSLWTQYASGVRTYCGITFPEGLLKNQKLDEPAITPTTKEDVHDRPISPSEIIEEGWMSAEDWEAASGYAAKVFTFGQKPAAEHGLILVDTKYEMGKDSEGNIVLIDEIHTPDSSRYWLSDSFERRVSQGLEPENIDKEFLRLWFKDNCDPYNDEKLPKAPDELVIELSYRYIQLYEMITGNEFQFPDSSDSAVPVLTRLQRNLEEYRQKRS